jgi:ribosomal protein S18 acetylase RimI-like enzyme
MIYELRLATQDDYDFLRSLNEITMKDYIISTYGSWDEEIEEKYFLESFESFTYQIIMVDGQDAGCLAITKSDSEIFISEIQLLPQYQHRGIGGKIFKSLIQESEMLKLPLNLDVLKVNQIAREFYQKLGFVQVGENKTHELMSRQPTFES